MAAKFYTTRNDRTRFNSFAMQICVDGTPRDLQRQIHELVVKHNPVFKAKLSFAKETKTGLIPMDFATTLRNYNILDGTWIKINIKEAGPNKEVQVKELLFIDTNMFTICFLFEHLFFLKPKLVFDVSKTKEDSDLHKLMDKAFDIWRAKDIAEAKAKSKTKAKAKSKSDDFINSGDDSESD